MCLTEGLSSSRHDGHEIGGNLVATTYIAQQFLYTDAPTADADTSGSARYAGDLRCHFRHPGRVAPGRPACINIHRRSASAHPVMPHTARVRVGQGLAFGRAW